VWQSPEGNENLETEMNSARPFITHNDEEIEGESSDEKIEKFSKYQASDEKANQQSEKSDSEIKLSGGPISRGMSMQKLTDERNKEKKSLNEILKTNEKMEEQKSVRSGFPSLQGFRSEDGEHEERNSPQDSDD
jgi:hypothetical protein